MKLEFMEFVSYIFYGILGSSAILSVNILTRLSRAVEDLNVKLAVLIEKTAGHEKWLEKHDNEIGDLRQQNICTRTNCNLIKKE